MDGRWQDRAAGVTGGEVSTAVWVVLWFHIVVAVVTMVLLPVVGIRALRGFDRRPRPGRQSASHQFWGRVVTVSLVLTAVSSWIFYVMAFTG